MLEDFKSRKITAVPKGTDFEEEISVERYRDSKGRASICIIIFGKRLCLDNSEDSFSTGYEQAAFELSRLLDEAASDPCLLESKKEESDG